MNDPPPAKRTRRFETLSVYSYRTPVATYFVPHGEVAEGTTHALIRCLFGPRTHDLFSFTFTAEGRFFCLDEQLLGLFERSKRPRDLWRCLNIHEASTLKKGNETSGTMAALSQQLAGEQIAVLDCSTLTRNFILVRHEHAERALQCLQDVIKEAAGAEGTDENGSVCTSSGAVPGAPACGGALAAVRLALLPGEVTIAGLSLGGAARWARTRGCRMGASSAAHAFDPATRTVAQTSCRRARTRCCNCCFSRPPERRHRPSSTTSRWAARSR